MVISSSWYTVSYRDVVFTEAIGIYAMQFYVVLINTSRSLWRTVEDHSISFPLSLFRSIKLYMCKLFSADVLW